MYLYLTLLTASDWDQHQGPEQTSSSASALPVPKHSNNLHVLHRADRTGLSRLLKRATRLLERFQPQSTKCRAKATAVRLSPRGRSGGAAGLRLQPERGPRGGAAAAAEPGAGSAACRRPREGLGGGSSCPRRRPGPRWRWEPGGDAPPPSAQGGEAAAERRPPPGTAAPLCGATRQLPGTAPVTAPPTGRGHSDAALIDVTAVGLQLDRPGPENAAVEERLPGTQQPHLTCARLPRRSEATAEPAAMPENQARSKNLLREAEWFSPSLDEVSTLETSAPMSSPALQRSRCLKVTDTDGGPDLWCINQLLQLPAGLQRERCCSVCLQQGVSSKVREFLAAALCFSPLPWDGMYDPVFCPLGGPEQIEKMLCVVSTNAFKCIFPQIYCKFWVMLDIV
ncbi:uncharacterized protein LOC141946846 [Strix uralensis]|uniref:uncharacterized protein LOC141946846 n=1 Tax=Strix uralensis TaxID=36305 RepID=UPI003DA6FDE0